MNRRLALLVPAVFVPAHVHKAHAAPAPGRELIRLFDEAMQAGADLDLADNRWSKAVEAAPLSGPALSNRGTIRLQQGRWAAAATDFEQALRLDEEAGFPPDASVLNNLANSYGALGRWDEAIPLFKKAAAADSSMEPIALANLSHALFQTNDTAGAVQWARRLLREDPSFLDMRCALAAFLWASGDRDGAENEWERLQQSLDGLGGDLYRRDSAIARVQNRWPPRSTAALQAFLALSREGTSRGYGGAEEKFKF